MTQRRKLSLPSGLPKRFLDGQPGFQRLRKFLEIPNTKSVEAVLDAVKHSVPRAGKLPGAQRRRAALVAYYENPESRRQLWRQALDPHRQAAPHEQPVPSLEFIALQRHDGKFHEREVDIAAAEDAFRDFPDVVESIADTPAWQRPAIAAWPALHRDIAEWSDLPDDRREATLLATVRTALQRTRRSPHRRACGSTARKTGAPHSSADPRWPPTSSIAARVGGVCPSPCVAVYETRSILAIDLIRTFTTG